MNNNCPTSYIADLNGVPALFVNGSPYISAAYMTYLEEFSDYALFASAGYRFFSVPVLFAGRWISITDGFRPFNKGVFDQKGRPDYSAFENSIKKIVDVCPDAYIIPRLNISLPVWWEEENPEEVNIRADGSTCRESFYSEKWLSDVQAMLTDFLNYAQSSEYASHIIGWHLACGNTEEWFHFDMNGGCCKNACKAFERFMAENYPALKFRGLPDISLINKDGCFIDNPYLSAYLDFASVTVAKAICTLAHTAKKATGEKLVIGAFYGYSLEVTSPLHGTHSLKTMLECKDIDFLCSPNSYLGIRAPDYDWPEMYPADSVRLHGKMCFQECDIRTHLTVLLNKKDPKTDPLCRLSDKIWHGLNSKEQAVYSIRKSFCRQLIKGNGFWWFDMWGGWYADSDLINEMKRFREIYDESLKLENRGSTAELAAFIDEGSYKYLTACSLRDSNYKLRKNLGQIGVPWDVYDIYDFKTVYKKYKAVVFLTCAVTEDEKAAVEICKKENIPYIVPTEQKEDFSIDEIKKLCENGRIEILCTSGDILYINNNYAALCALTDGEKRVKLGRKRIIKSLFGLSSEVTADTLVTNMKEGEVQLFSLADI